MRSLIATVALAVMLAACGTGSPQPTPTASPSAPATSVPPADTQSDGTASGQPGGSAPTCAQFGSISDASSADPLLMSTLFGESIRIGRHDCYDRFVLELHGTGGQPGWTVGYRSPLIGDPSGEVVALAGGAALEVIVRVWSVTPYEGMPAEWLPFAGPMEIVPEDFPVIREVRYLSAFEGTTQLGIGVDEQHPFRAFWLDDPPRLVVDISHN